MSAAVNEPQALSAGHLVASLGPYFLYYVNEDYYQLFSPDSICPRAWLEHHLPDGDWYTEWSGTGDSMIVHITR